MTSRRLLKAAEAIREVVASSILTELRDPRVKDVTVISVEVSPDMREAKVSVSIMGSEKQKQNSLRGLQNSAGFLQSKIADRIDSRYTPRLQFVLNKGADNALVVGELLAKIQRERETGDPSDSLSDRHDADQIADALSADVKEPAGSSTHEDPPRESSNDN
ncbi:MAG: 30S ribosome-binding factor RbfA [Pirellulaceae bacterium]|nr:30S ribosome-binding factor RbfA [Pirellulaceae bacterium]